MTTDPTSAAAGTTTNGPMAVLCVDDHPDTADSLGTLLGLSGFEVAVAHDAAEALAAVAGGFRPRACILDITMPGMDGCELARRLRAEVGGEKMLMVALTALGDYRSLEWMAESGFDLHFAKPVEPSALYTALSNYEQNGRPA